MKKSITLILLLACISVSPVIAQTREARNVGKFTKISFRMPGKLYLRQGPVAKVELEGKPDILSQIETTVEGNKLLIGKEGKWSDWKGGDEERINVYITMPTIEGLNVGGSGDLIAETKVKSQDLELNVSGSGSMRIETEVSGELDANGSGSGEIIVKGKCKNVDSDVSGSGKVAMTITVEALADFSISGSGKIEASGSANAVKTSISGSGKVLAASLETNTCEVKIAGSGDVEVNVKEELNATISGSGNVSYKGNPKKLSSHAAGSGKVSKM